MASNFTLVDNSGRVLSEIERAAAAAVTKAALLIEAQAKVLAPHDTGGLVDSISHDVEVDAGKVTAKIGSGLDYAIYQEFGTGEFAENGAGRKGGWAYTKPDGTKHFTMGTKPKKFMRTSFRKNKAKVKELLGAELGGTFRGKR